MSHATPASVYVGLGGNQGDVSATLAQALQAIAGLPQTSVLARSRTYRTPAWGLTTQADFLNAAIELRTGLSPVALLAALLAIERQFGRDRANEVRWGPRTLDLDLLLYGELQCETAGLSLPHPRMHERAFVLLPLLDIAPTLTLPGQGSLADLLSGLDRNAIVALD